MVYLSPRKYKIEQDLYPDCVFFLEYLEWESGGPKWYITLGSQPCPFTKFPGFESSSEAVKAFEEHYTEIKAEKDRNIDESSLKKLLDL